MLPKVCVTKEIKKDYFTAVPIEGMHSLDTTVDFIIRKGRAQSASVKVMKACIIDCMEAFNFEESTAHLTNSDKNNAIHL